MATETDISPTLAAKTDQINADDLKPSGTIGHPITVRVVSVSMKAGDDQPMTIKVEDFLPYRPCKTMRRLLAEAWGKDATKWKGRRMTIYTDPDISFGDQKKIGGIRISHLSDINGPLTVNLTATKGRKQPWTVQPIAKDAPPWTLGQIHPSWEADAPAFAADLAAMGVTVEQVDAYLQSEAGAGFRKWWNGGDCMALGCSWVPTRWRVGLSDALKKKPELAALIGKIAIEKPAPVAGEQGN